jgi:hypothetical protein
MTRETEQAAACQYLKDHSRNRYGYKINKILKLGQLTSTLYTNHTYKTQQQ